jgi:hypothetical protein
MSPYGIIHEAAYINKQKAIQITQCIVNIAWAGLVEYLPYVCCGNVVGKHTTLNKACNTHVLIVLIVNILNLLSRICCSLITVFLLVSDM